MNGSPELLEFYLVEATEYVDTLDQLIGSANVVPDGNAFIATARALRGSSAMAKADRIAELALVVEQLANGVRDSELAWSAELFRALRATVDDLRFAVRGIRTWGEREETRTAARLADLQRFLPTHHPRTATPADGASTPVFIALQASAIAAELDAFVAAPTHRRALDDALNRARTMRGIAGIGDYAPLADVADSIDSVGRGLMPDAALSRADAELFRAAAAVLRRASDELRSTGRSDPQSAEVARFASAVAALRSPPHTPTRVVRIEELFYADAGPHIVQRAADPATTPEQRFRQDVVSRAEHVRRLVADARQVHDVAGRDRATRDLASALLDFENVAASFGAHQVAAFFGQAGREGNLLHPTLLDAIDTGSRLLLSPTDSLEEIERRLAILERSRRATPVVTPVVAPVATSAQAPTQTASTSPDRSSVTTPSATPTGTPARETPATAPPTTPRVTATETPRTPTTTLPPDAATGQTGVPVRQPTAPPAAPTDVSSRPSSATPIDAPMQAPSAAPRRSTSSDQSVTPSPASFATPGVSRPAAASSAMPMSVTPSATLAHQEPMPRASTPRSVESTSIGGAAATKPAGSPSHPAGHPDVAPSAVSPAAARPGVSTGVAASVTPAPGLQTPAAESAPRATSPGGEAEAGASPLRAAPPPGAAATRRTVSTPTGAELSAFLATGLAGLVPLDEEPMSEPAELDDDAVVPIESLLYRGESALLRAISVRDEMRTRGALDNAALAEIFDLLDLARTE